MKTEEYVQVIRASINLHIQDLELVLPYFDELRKVHTKLQNKLEYLLSDNFTYDKKESKEEINAIAKDIKDICLTAVINYQFSKLPDTWVGFFETFRYTKSFCKYSYKGIDITNLIVFTQKKKQKINKLNDFAKIDISELDLKFDDDEDKGDSFITEGNEL